MLIFSHFLLSSIFTNIFPVTQGFLRFLLSFYPIVSSAVVCIHLFRWIQCSLLLPDRVSKLVAFSSKFRWNFLLSPSFLSFSMSTFFVTCLPLIFFSRIFTSPISRIWSELISASSNYETVFGLVYSLSDTACYPHGLSTCIVFFYVAQTLYFQ